MTKSPDAFRTISEVSEWLDTPTYVLRFWESRFPQIKPVKRAGGRRYYRPEDMMLLGGIKKLLHFDEKSIKAVKKLLKQEGAKHVMSLSPDLDTQVVSPTGKADAKEKADIAEIVKSVAQQDTQEAKKPAVEVRVVKKAKLQNEDNGDKATAAAAQPVKADPMAAAKAQEAERVAAAKQAAAEKARADEDAEEWGELSPDMIRNAPYAIKSSDAYDPDTFHKIETLYYSLRMVRNGMQRAKAKQADHAR